MRFHRLRGVGKHRRVHHPILQAWKHFRYRRRLADEELGRLIGARTHKINRSLERVTALPADDEVSQLVDKYAGADDEDEQ